jgi:DNA-binding transcriptional regulator YiaG
MHWPPSARLKYPFDEFKDAIVRRAWANARNYEVLTAAITDAARRLGYPRYIVKMRAQRLGLTYDVRHKWTAEEELYLLNNAGSISTKRMQRKLKRGWTAIEAKIHSMGLRSAVTRGMTQQDLASALGVARETVIKWERAGYLQRNGGRFYDKTIETFVRTHPELYDLRRVDQDWFKALLFPSARCFIGALPAKPRPYAMQLEERFAANA